MNIEDLKDKIISKRKIIILAISLIAVMAIIMYIININNLEENILIDEIDENISNNTIKNEIGSAVTDNGEKVLNNDIESVIANNMGNVLENSIIKESENIPNNAEKKQVIVVHIAGQVVNNGIVELEEGQRIVDAIEKAGGATNEADLSRVNLAYVLEDGQKIYIPKINENFTGEYVTNESGVVEEENTTSDKDTSKKTNKIININTATVEELQNLQGIGESIAKKIVEYRKANGKFNSIEDIKNVSGIGESKFNKIKDFICVK